MNSFHSKSNAAIRKKLSDHNITMWQLADAITPTVAESTLYRWFRRELSGEQLERVNRALDVLTERK